MNKYNGLLLDAASKYHIQKGTKESENDWKVRIVYSICGLMAYASLWDDSENEPISIVHLKKRVRDTFENYRLMYPELSGYLPRIAEELEEEIADQFLSVGVVYHRPNRISPSRMHEKPFGNIVFQRGIALDSISCISGIGFFSARAQTSDINGVKDMFGLEHGQLRELWRLTFSNASWTENLLIEQSAEFLRLSPPFSKGYWVNKPDTTGCISLLRTGMRGDQLYFLYRYSDAGIEVSPLPQWKVDSYNYRSLANACLSFNETLPPIEYFEDGSLVHLRMNYLLPPRELAFLKLYSWPGTCASLPSDFRRKLSAEVFNAIKNILSDEGYEFKEGMI